MMAAPLSLRGAESHGAATKPCRSAREPERGEAGSPQSGESGILRVEVRVRRLAKRH